MITMTVSPNEDPDVVSEPFQLPAVPRVGDLILLPFHMEFPWDFVRVEGIAWNAGGEVWVNVQVSQA